MGGLRLDARKAVLKGGDKPPIVLAGDPDKSRLAARLTGVGGQPLMPLGAEKLSDAEIGAIRNWIVAGAEWPDGVGVETEAPAQHWAYVKPSRPDPPGVRNEVWLRNPLDGIVKLTTRRRFCPGEIVRGFSLSANTRHLLPVSKNLLSQESMMDRLEMIRWRIECAAWKRSTSLHDRIAILWL